MIFRSWMKWWLAGAVVIALLFLLGMPMEEAMIAKRALIQTEGIEAAFGGAYWLLFWRGFMHYLAWSAVTFTAAYATLWTLWRVATSRPVLGFFKWMNSDT